MAVNYVNIIGYGYVGGAMGHLCKSNDVKFCTYDVIKKDEPDAVMNHDELSRLVEESELQNQHNVYFICVPTPPSESGECNTTIVENVINQLNSLVTLKTTVVIKSTVQPGTTRCLSDQYKNVNIVFCPEFLKEKTFQEDMYNADFCLLGFNNLDNQELCDSVSDVMKLLYKHKTIDVVFRSYEECELFKYTINVYLAVKVWYFNEVSEVCDKMGVKYTDLHSLFKYEPRIGESHTSVPGHDDKLGFGGKCLPKETKALCYLQEHLSLDNSVLKHILRRNLEMRGGTDD